MRKLFIVFFLVWESQFSLSMVTVNFLINRFVISWYGAIVVNLSRCKFLLYVIHIYRTCFLYNEDVLREEQVFHHFLLKSYDCFWRQAEISISVKLGYHSCQPHVANLYRETTLVFNYFCRQKTVFYNSSLWFRWKRKFSSNVTNCTN